MGLMVRRRKKKQLALQLTSLLDMFTIILVFLLQSFQADDEDFVLHAGVKLPASDSESAFKSAVNVAITGEAVFVEGTAVLPLTNGMAPPELYEQGSAQPVVDAIGEAWKTRKLEGEDIVATIQANQDLPYETIDLVMRSSAFAGCYRFRLVVERG